MRVRVTLVRTLSIDRPPHFRGDFCLDDVRDSLLDHVHDEEEATFETSDEKFLVTPNSVHKFLVEEEEPQEQL